MKHTLVVLKDVRTETVDRITGKVERIDKRWLDAVLEDVPVEEWSPYMGSGSERVLQRIEMFWETGRRLNPRIALHTSRIKKNGEPYAQSQRDYYYAGDYLPASWLTRLNYLADEHAPEWF